MVEQVVPHQPKEDYDGADIRPPAHGGPHIAVAGDALKEAAAACGKPTTEQTPGRSCDPWQGQHAGAGFLAKAAALGRPTLEQSVPQGLYPVERIHVEAVHERLYPMGGTPCWNRGTVCGGIGEQHKGSVMHQPQSPFPVLLRVWGERR